ncbi:MAG: heparan-alpha-glucosaminide N-acetyltransferase [Bauldia sp.]
MVVYHFAWDLSNANLIAVDVGVDPAWRWFAHLIAGTFLAIVGISLVLASEGGIDWPSYFRRLALIVAGAAGVSATTWLVFPDAFVFFGILHAIAFASVAALPFLALPAWLAAAAGALCLAAPAFLAIPAFNTPLLLWLGLYTVPPASVDFVPVFPWFGVTLLGVAAARFALAWRPATAWARPLPPGWLPQGLRLLGRWSLVIYLVHQPLLFGVVGLAARVMTPADRLAEFRENCRRSCSSTGAGEAPCQSYCSCVSDRASEQGLVLAVLGNDFSVAEYERWQMILTACRPAAFVTPRP